ncbi:MAG TPA: Holliday junction branch migration DNA helicase RuvB [Polyangia bacterium]
MTRRKHVDGGPGPAAPEAAPREVAATPRSSERQLEDSVRPRTFDEYIGQRQVVDNIKVFVEAAKRRGQALDHMLFCGPPGLGKTTLAVVIANALGATLRQVAAPTIEHKGTLAALLTSLGPGDVLFIDEIHRLTPVIEETLYPAMEDYRLDVVLNEGPHAQPIMLQLARFTLLGATTRTGLLTGPLLSRFRHVARLDYYGPDELTTIIKRSARLLQIPIDDGGAQEIGRRSRGTPRIANHLLASVRDFAEVEGEGVIDREIADYALQRLKVDASGLDEMDRRVLDAIIRKFDGGPVGIESIAAAVAEERDTLEEVYEPYLIQQGFVQRTPRGRVATRLAYEHLKLPPRRKAGQGELF